MMLTTTILISVLDSVGSVMIWLYVLKYRHPLLLQVYVIVMSVEYRCITALYTLDDSMLSRFCRYHSNSEGGTPELC